MQNECYVGLITVVCVCFWNLSAPNLMEELQTRSDESNQERIQEREEYQSITQTYSLNSVSVYRSVMNIFRPLMSCQIPVIS